MSGVSSEGVSGVVPARVRRMVVVSCVFAVSLVMAFAPPALAPPPDFEPQDVYSMGASTHGVTTGDFDNDDNVDIVSANVAQTGGQSVAAIRLGNGTGDFGNETFITVGVLQNSVESGDFDGDGNRDLIFRGQGTQLRVLPGNGNGTFGAAINFNVGGDPSTVVSDALAVGDFNSDTKPDIATVRSSAATDAVVVLTNASTGTGNFTFTLSTFSAGADPVAIEAGDFDGAGFDDLATANSAGAVNVLLSDGAGGFGSATAYSTGASALRHITDGDFDGNTDGNAVRDLVASDNGSTTSNDVFVFSNNGSGAFGAANATSTGDGARSATVGDYNNDGNLDIAAGGSGANKATVLSGNGNGAFGTPAGAQASFPVESTPRSIATADFDENGKPDLVTANVTNNNASVLINANIPPTIELDANNPTDVDESQNSRTYQFSITDPDPNESFDFAPGFPKCGDEGTLIGTPQTTASSGSFECRFPDGKNPALVSEVAVKVEDDDDAPSNTATQNVTVKNVAPMVTIAAEPAEVDENTTAERTFTFSATDPGNDTLALDSFNCGSIGAPVAGSGTILGGDRPATGSFKCVFPDGGHDAPPTSSTLSATVGDGDGGTGSNSRSVAVKNVSPTINEATNTGPIDEGGSATITVDATDPAGTNDTLRYRFDCDGDFGNPTGNGFEIPGEGADEGINNAPCVFDDNGNFTVNVLVLEEDGGKNISSTTVEVANVAPTVVDFNGPTTADEGATETYTFEVSDPGAADTHTPDPDCGDGRDAEEDSLEYDQATNEGEFDCFFPNGDEMVDVSVLVADDDGDDGSGGTTVEVANVAPAISAIDNVTIAEDGTTDAIPFTVADVVADTVVVSASSGNTDLIQSDDITLGGSGANRTVTVKPDANESGSAKITVSADDGEDESVEEFIVTVTPSPDPPDAKDDEATTREETTVGINVLGNDADPDGDSLTLVGITEPPTGGTARILAGRVFYTPKANFHGEDTFMYSVRDGDGNTDTARVDVTVTPVNDAPVARLDFALTRKNQSTDINVLANDTDADGDTLSVASFTQPGRGTVTRNDDGTLKYTPPNNAIGLAVFTYRANDGTANSNLTLVAVVVTR